MERNAKLQLKFSENDVISSHPNYGLTKVYLRALWSPWLPGKTPLN